MFEATTLKHLMENTACVRVWLVSKLQKVLFLTLFATIKLKTVAEGFYRKLE